MQIFEKLETFSFHASVAKLLLCDRCLCLICCFTLFLNEHFAEAFSQIVFWGSYTQRVNTNTEFVNPLFVTICVRFGALKFYAWTKPVRPFCCRLNLSLTVFCGKLMNFAPPNFSLFYLKYGIFWKIWTSRVKYLRGPHLPWKYYLVYTGIIFSGANCCRHD